MYETKMELVPMMRLWEGETNSDGFPKRCDSSKISDKKMFSCLLGDHNEPKAI